MGAANVMSHALMDYSGRGPTVDGRTKPDVLGPTNVYAASTASNTSLDLFSGTSAATPNAGGAAALGRRFANAVGPIVDPGQVYALFVNAGRNGTRSATNNNIGGGLIAMPISGQSWWGAVTALPRNGAVVNVTVTLSSITTETLTASIWWPESAGAHNDVDLYVYNPQGVLVGLSTSGDGVFEKVRIPSGSVTNGTWTMQVRSYNVGTSQLVYGALSCLK